MLSKDPNVEQQHLIDMLAEIFALKDGKRIPW